jgi:hypothetical protein
MSAYHIVTVWCAAGANGGVPYRPPFGVQQPQMVVYYISHRLVCSSRKWWCTISVTVWQRRSQIHHWTGPWYRVFLEKLIFRQLEIPSILRILNFHESIHKSPPTFGLCHEFLKPSRYSHTIFFVPVILFSHIGLSIRIALFYYNFFR